MTSSTPSPSAEELADLIEKAAGEPGLPLPSLNAIGRLFKFARQTIPFLRRLAETERERDAHRRELEYIRSELSHESSANARLKSERDALRDRLAECERMLAAKQIALGEAFAVIERYRLASQSRLTRQ